MSNKHTHREQDNASTETYNDLLSRLLVQQGIEVGQSRRRNNIIRDYMDVRTYRRYTQHKETLNCPNQNTHALFIELLSSLKPLAAEDKESLHAAYRKLNKARNNAIHRKKRRAQPEKILQEWCILAKKTEAAIPQSHPEESSRLIHLLSSILSRLIAVVSAPNESPQCDAPKRA